jgi:ribosome-associated protein
MKEPLTSQPNQDSLELALDAALNRKAHDVVVLDLEGLCSFSDRFVICSGTSVRQTQSIADNVDERLRQAGIRLAHKEGYSEGEWILLDYLDFVVHIFTERTREFYDLERLWRVGKRREVREPAGREA